MDQINQDKSVISRRGRVTRTASITIAAVIALIIPGALASPASASTTNAWSTCIAPYQSLWQETSGDVSDLIFNIGFANCAAELGDAAWNAENLGLYSHYYSLWRVHYAAAARAAFAVAVEADSKLEARGLKGLTSI